MRGQTKRGTTDSQGRALRFALRFFAYVLLISALARVDLVALDGRLSRGLTYASASAVAAAFQWVGADIAQNGNALIYRSTPFRIVEECTGIEVMALFLAAILAFPSGWRHRALGLALGLPILLVLNWVRMVTLVLLGAHSRDALHYGHVYVWPAVLLTVSLGIWIYWARNSNDEAHSLV